MKSKTFYAQFSGENLAKVMEDINNFTAEVSTDEAHGYSFGHHTHVWTGALHHLVVSYTVWDIVPPGVGIK